MVITLRAMMYLWWRLRSQQRNSLLVIAYQRG